MVFWKTYPIKNIFKKVNQRFTQELFNKEYINSPTGIKCELINIKNNKIELKNIKIFLKKYFGEPPNKPIFDISIINLLNNKDIIFYVKDKLNNIVGCIRYHYIGLLMNDNKEIYCVDCFCIHPEWRGKGVGDYLLTFLHIYANKNKIPNAIFLKEGNQLGIIHIPYYSGIYVYKIVNNIISKYVNNISIKNAYKIIDIYKKIKPNTFIIINKETKNQIWKLYKKEIFMVLVCFQDTHQYTNDNKKMGWITCWIESPNMTDEMRGIISEEIVDSVYGIFDYIWMNKEWIGNSINWTTDGEFHWYLYQWRTNYRIDKSYCLLN